MTPGNPLCLIKRSDLVLGDIAMTLPSFIERMKIYILHKILAPGNIPLATHLEGISKYAEDTELTEAQHSVFGLIYGFIASQCLQTCMESNIFQKLAESSIPLTTDDLIQGVHDKGEHSADFLARLLRVLSAYGVLEEEEGSSDTPSSSRFSTSSDYKDFQTVFDAHVAPDQILIPTSGKLSSEEAIRRVKCVGQASFYLHIATTIGIPFVLAQSKTPLTAAEVRKKLPLVGKLAFAATQGRDRSRLDLKPDALGPLLKVLSSVGVFKEEMEKGVAKYSATKQSHLLARPPNPRNPGGPRMFVYAITISSTMVSGKVKNLTAIAKSGSLEGLKSKEGIYKEGEAWQVYENNDEAGDIFDLAMTETSQETLAVLLREYNGFGSKGSLVDVGGGRGLSSAAIKAKHAGLEVICFDLPGVVRRSGHVEGVKHVAGSMFEAIPKADVIFMKHILHDWSDAKCHQILRNCHSALPPTGKLIIADAVVPGPQDQSEKGRRIKCYDIVMMVSQPGGKERTAGQWQSLLQSAGFVVDKTIPISDHIISIIEARKI